jgi:hypothetical protein
MERSSKGVAQLLRMVTLLYKAPGSAELVLGGDRGLLEGEDGAVTVCVTAIVAKPIVRFPRGFMVVAPASGIDALVTVLVIVVVLVDSMVGLGATTVSKVDANIHQYFLHESSECIPCLFMTFVIASKAQS